jgi:hypothetical protein
MVTVEDAAGNRVPGQPVQVSASGTGNTWTAASGTADAAGVYHAQLASTKAETKTLTATIGSTVATGQVMFDAAGPSTTQSTLSIAPASVVADGTSVATITVVLKDASGNLVANHAVTLSSSTVSDLFAPATGATSASGVFTATIAATVAGTKTIQAQIGGGNLSGQVTFTPGPAVAAKSSLAANPSSVTANGSAAITITVTARDANSNLVSSVPVQLTATGSANTFAPTSGSTKSGVFTATLASTKAESKTVTATLAGFTLMGTVSFTPGPVSVVTLAAVPFSLPADGVAQSTLSGTVKDAQGNGLSQAVTLSATGVRNTFSATTVMSNAQGAFTATLASTSAGAKIVTAAVGQATGTTTVTFTPAPALARSTMTIDPAWVAPGTTTTATVTIRDGDGNPVANRNVTFLAVVTGGTFTITPGAGLTNAQGVITALIGSSVAQHGKVDAQLADFTLEASVLFKAPCATFSLSNRNIFNLSSPYDVTVADFDGDGHLDLAVAEKWTSSIETYRGHGDFTFDAPGIVNNDRSLSIAAADVNNDGHPDLIASLWVGGGVNVLLGHGDGTFAQAATYSSPGRPYDAVLFDANRDGNLDIALPDLFNNKLNVLTGKGDGTFNAPVMYATGAAPEGIAAGDFDGDGWADLAVVNANEATVSVLWNGKNGTFLPAVPVAIQSGGTFLGAADLNHDGLPDLVASTNSNSVSVLLSKGAGSFVAASNYAVGQLPIGIATADVNGDGAIDLLVVNETANTISALFNSGSGTFPNSLTFSAGTAPSGIAVGDLDGDGRPDVVIAGQPDMSGAGTVVVLQNTCN